MHEFSVQVSRIGIGQHRMDCSCDKCAGCPCPRAGGQPEIARPLETRHQRQVRSNGYNVDHENICCTCVHGTTTHVPVSDIPVPWSAQYSCYLNSPVVGYWKVTYLAVKCLLCLDFELTSIITCQRHCVCSPFRGRGAPGRGNLRRVKYNDVVPGTSVQATS